jgi:hypothetical protein
MSWGTLKKYSKFVLLGTGFGLGTIGTYNTYQKFQYQQEWLKAEDARQKVSHPKIKTRLEEIQELKKRKEYDLIIIGRLHFCLILSISFCRRWSDWRRHCCGRCIARLKSRFGRKGRFWRCDLRPIDETRAWWSEV